MPVLPSGTTFTASTVRDLIRSAMRLISVKAAGEVPTAEEEQDGLYSLNTMLDSWNTERLMVSVLDREEFTLTPGLGTYTMGPGADFDVARPTKIEYAEIDTSDTLATVIASQSGYLRHDPVETPNGVIVTFTFVGLPADARNYILSYDGVITTSGFTQNGTQLTFSTAPAIGAELFIYF